MCVCVFVCVPCVLCVCVCVCVCVCHVSSAATPLWPLKHKTQSKPKYQVPSILSNNSLQLNGSKSEAILISTIKQKSPVSPTSPSMVTPLLSPFCLICCGLLGKPPD